ncbi:hypothetical protein VTI74DRAFT_10591 [Chaetomium olivicolor]
MLSMLNCSLWWAASILSLACSAMQAWSMSRSSSTEASAIWDGVGVANSVMLSRLTPLSPVAGGEKMPERWEPRKPSELAGPAPATAGTCEEGGGVSDDGMTGCVARSSLSSVLNDEVGSIGEFGASVGGMLCCDEETIESSSWGVFGWLIRPICPSRGAPLTACEAGSESDDILRGTDYSRTSSTREFQKKRLKKAASVELRQKEYQR